ncbi:MAG: PilN domain-containing protein [Deltaproteobacteria bacterium]|jgi:Tfp pilus assembly protein PilN|nr:PilN domain-containing protein [Deltaproteobacteria bacterium]
MMIKINLLPIESFRQTASGQLSVTIFAFVIVGFCVALYLFKGMVLDTKIESLEKTRNEASSKLADLQATSQDALKQTTEFVNQLVQVSAISELEERRRDQTRLLHAIAGQVLTANSWLTSVSHNKGAIILKGMATDFEVVAEFQHNLEQNIYLTKVELIRATRDTTINNVRLVTFEIHANTVFPGALLLEEGLPDSNLPPRELMAQMVTAASPDLGKILQEAQAGPSTL